ncbi:MAG: flagellar motor switch protein FliN, partial [Tissierellales bacterium]
AEGEKTLEVLKTDGPIIKISFKMIVEDLIDSNIMQLIPIDFGQQLVENLIGDSGLSNSLEESETVAVDPIELDISNSRKADDMKQRSTPSQESLTEEQVVVKKPKFEAFDGGSQVSRQRESIDLVGDIPVELTVELGRTIRKIGEILEYGPGTVIELDKLVGEPLDIYANGKFIARGEVVVIDDNFGVRITDIDNNYGKNK